ncbi:MAG: hypothetical protein B6230_06510 [Desulfobacteraceae bacterium 4572_89]|nr:MAG: hypothetical protein B6230_06510 [Desulfobacteraceae bacterium 4572_89]
MNALKRVLPSSLPAEIAEMEERNNYSIVLKYKNEMENSPWIVDLSHCVKLDFQCNGNPETQAMGMDLPKKAGRAVCSGEWLVSALGPSQFSFIHILGKMVELPEDHRFTDITDGRCLFAMGGNGADRLMGKITRMNFSDSTLELPCVLQGPMLHTFGQLYILEKAGQKIFLLSLGRGYARSVIHAVLDIGAPYGLTPSGLDRFTQAVTK